MTTVLFRTIFRVARNKAEEIAFQAAVELLREVKKGRIWVEPFERGGEMVVGHWRDVPGPSMIPLYDPHGGKPVVTGTHRSATNYHFQFSDGRRGSFFRRRQHDPDLGKDYWLFGVSTDVPHEPDERTSEWEARTPYGIYSYRSRDESRTFDIFDEDGFWRMRESGWKTKWGEEEYKDDWAPQKFKNKAAAERWALAHVFHHSRITEEPGPLDEFAPHKGG